MIHSILSSNTDLSEAYSIIRLKIKADNYVSSAKNSIIRGLSNMLYVLAYDTSVHLKSLCICIRKLVYLIKRHNTANYQLNSYHEISSFRLFDPLSLSHQPACIKTLTVYVEIKCQLDGTEVSIADLIACSTCFRHHCAHHQELKTNNKNTYT